MQNNNKLPIPYFLHESVVKQLNFVSDHILIELELTSVKTLRAQPHRKVFVAFFPNKHSLPMHSLREQKKNYLNARCF